LARHIRVSAPLENRPEGQYRELLMAGQGALLATHESLQSHRIVKSGSERSFGIVFCIVFLVVGGLPLVGGGSARWWAIAIAAAFLAIALIRPRLLAPLNRLWFRFGLLLHHIVNPIIMGFLFFVIVLPTSLLLRMFRKDLLRLGKKPQNMSYWIVREQPAPKPGSMSKQF
jgi:Saxitoxin biosynthesis operon protein SxtJ